MKSYLFNYRTLLIYLSQIALLSCNPELEDSNDPCNGANGVGNGGGGGGNNVSGGVSHSCGITDFHNPNLNYESIQDTDGNTYKTIVIGDQTWMAENLNTSVYRNGDPIENINDIHDWLHSDTIEAGAWCYYNNNGNAFECPYGKLYNFYAINDSRGICPIGWHVPSDSEWQELIGFIDPAINLSANGSAGGAESDTAGYAMNSIWEEPLFVGFTTNRVGFSNIGAGVRYSNPFSNDFDAIGVLSCYWSSTSQVNPINQSSLTVKGRMIGTLNVVYRLDYPTYAGLSLRCVED